MTYISSIGIRFSAYFAETADDDQTKHTTMLNQQSTLNHNQGTMNQTLGSLADQLRKIDDDKAVIQSLIKRIDVLETTPDATKEMLAEYARDFDTLDATVRGIITGINQYQDNENAV